MARKMTTMRDSMGQDIPIKYINKYDRARDKYTRRILARFRRIRSLMEQAVVDTLSDIEAIQEARETEPSAKGNFQCQSFDGLIQVAIDQSYNIRLDDRVREARDMMLDYARSLCAKAGSDASALFELVEEAFAANRSGGLAVGRVLSLCRRNITAPAWLRARKLLLDSIQTDLGKAYLRVSTRHSTQHDFKMLRLDIADCWPTGEEV